MTSPKRKVRWREGKTWRHGYLTGVVAVGANGMIQVQHRFTDAPAMVHVDQLQVSGKGPRGGQRWLPASEEAEHCVKCEQLDLFGGDAA